jgi:hypothetical protein
MIIIDYNWVWLAEMGRCANIKLPRHTITNKCLCLKTMFNSYFKFFLMSTMNENFLSILYFKKMMTLRIDLNIHHFIHHPIPFFVCNQSRSFESKKEKMNKNVNYLFYKINKTKNHLKRRILMKKVLLFQKDFVSISLPQTRRCVDGLR